MFTDSELTAIMTKLDRMRGPGDGLGAYLGDGISGGPIIRSKKLAEALQELISLRAKSEAVAPPDPDQ